MNGKIRKLKLTYPFKIAEDVKVDIFSVDEKEKYNGNKVHSIQEEIDPVTNSYVYKIFVNKNDNAQLWKSITPGLGICNKEIEYFIN